MTADMDSNMPHAATVRNSIKQEELDFPKETSLLPSYWSDFQRTSVIFREPQENDNPVV
jgi:hypothetical protein